MKYNLLSLRGRPADMVVPDKRVYNTCGTNTLDHFRNPKDKAGCGGDMSSPDTAERGHEDGADTSESLVYANESITASLDDCNRDDAVSEVQDTRENACDQEMNKDLYFNAWEATYDKSATRKENYGLQTVCNPNELFQKRRRERC